MSFSSFFIDTGKEDKVVGGAERSFNSFLFDTTNQEPDGIRVLDSLSIHSLLIPVLIACMLGAEPLCSFNSFFVDTPSQVFSISATYTAFNSFFVDTLDIAGIVKLMGSAFNSFFIDTITIC